MKIGIDARFLTHPQPGGFKTYTKRLITALAELDRENEYILYVDRFAESFLQLPPNANFTICNLPGSFPIIGMPWREQVSLALRARHDKLDLLHSPSLTAPLWLACPSVVTVHDMIWFFADRFTKPDRLSMKRRLLQWYYRNISISAARNANAIITVSHASKQSIVQHLGIPGERITVIHEAAHDSYQHVRDARTIAALEHRFNLQPSYVLAIGSADPRKNITALLQAYALLPTYVRQQHQLAIVLTHSYLAPQLAALAEQLGINEQLRFLERVSDAELAALYTAAALFVFPSLYEGFGLPILEAMKCGTPVVAANNSSIPEIAGDAALLVEAEDRRAMADAMAQLLADGELRSTLTQRGLRQAGRFSWAACARETVEVYRRCILAARLGGDLESLRQSVE